MESNKKYIFKGYKFRIYPNKKQEKIIKENISNKDKYHINKSVILNEKYIILPDLEKVKLKGYRKIPENGKISDVTITKEIDNKYFVSINIYYEINILGLDFSTNYLYVDSNGEKASDFGTYFKVKDKLNNKIKIEKSKLKRKQHCIDKKSTDKSKNYIKQEIKVEKLKNKLYNSKKDYLYKLAKRLADKYDVIGIENLSIKEMLENKTKNVNCFKKKINDVSWWTFIDILDRKMKEQGKYLIKIDKYFKSTQTCSLCNKVNDEYKGEENLTKRIYKCLNPNCKYHNEGIDRDINAAINIKNEAYKIYSGK